MMLQPGVAGPVLGMFAPVRRLLLESQAAGLAETLALLIEHQMPLPEALALAAEATGDKALIEAGAAIGSGDFRGRTFGKSRNRLTSRRPARFRR